MADEPSNGVQRALGLVEGRVEALHNTVEVLRLHQTEQVRKIEALHDSISDLQKRWEAHDNWERGARGVWIILASAVGAAMGWVASAWEGIVRWVQGA